MIELGEAMYAVQVECVSPKNTWLMCYQDDRSPGLAVFASHEEASAHAAKLTEEFPGSNYRVVKGVFTHYTTPNERMALMIAKIMCILAAGAFAALGYLWIVL